MNRVLLPLVATLAAALAVGPVAEPLSAQPAGSDDAVRERIRVRLESHVPGPAGVPSSLMVGGERLLASSALPAFYEARVYRPAWIGSDGRPLPRARRLLEAVRRADEHGLRPGDYHAPEIDSLLSRVSRVRGADTVDARLLAELDFLLTDAFLIYGSHLLAGRVDPRTIDSMWTATGRGADLAELLRRALAGDRVVEALESLAPDQREYALLQQLLQEYRRAATGGWPTVEPGPSLRVGAEGPGVASLTRRLAASGDLPGRAATGDTARFDEPVAEAVRRFQRRHGLEPDAVVGDSTRAAMNVPVERRIEQIELNLERWRWLPADLGRRHVRVNIANFEMEVREGDSTVVEMRAIVGRHYRQTPVFSDTMRYVVLNPSWNVPHTIAVNDILPQVKKGPSYLAQQGMQIFRGWDGEAAAIDPATVDWTALGPKSFPYRFVQRPGPLNALGQVKFMFPNRFSVYLHDTPSRGLFAQNVRTFSSGCIRLERPLELLDHLFRDSPQWTPAALRSALDTKREQTIRLPDLVPVHLQYWTAWAEDDGTIHFRRDIYGRDARLEKALEAPPPGS